MPDSTPFRPFRRTTGAHPFRRPVVWMSALGLCVWLAMSAPALSAGWMGKKIVRKPAPAAAGSQPGFAGTIRRLIGEAQAAADRGDLAAARKFSERANKLAVTCRTSLANDPDCSPEQTAELVRKFADPPATQNPAATPPQQNSPGIIVLTPMLDAPSSEAMPLAPPAPTAAAPEGIASPRRPPAIVSKRPVRNAKSPAVAASRAVDPWQTPGSRRHPSPSQSYLVMRSDWLADGADVEELIENPPDEPNERGPVRRPAASPRNPVETFEHREADAEPEVTTAIGRSSDASWEFDLNSVETDSSWDSRPMLETSPALSPPRADEPQRIGVWSGNAPAAGSSHQARTVVSLSEFLDPSLSLASRKSARPSAEDAPRMIETDFRTPSPAPSTATHDEPMIASSTSSPPEPPRRNDDDAEDSVATRCSPSTGPAVSTRDDPALDWLPASDPLAASRPAARNWFHGVWQKALASQTNQFAAGGLLLLLCGGTLFGLSFRRTTR